MAITSTLDASSDPTFGAFATQRKKVVASTLASAPTGPTVTYCYRNPDGSLGTTTDVNAIPVGAERERIVSG